MMKFQQQSLRAVCVVTAASLALGACNKDSQTKTQVETESPGTIASVSPSGDAADKRGEAMVRVVNAATDSKGLAIQSDDTHSLPAVDFGQTSAYQMIDHNWAKFQVRDNAQGAYSPLETNRELLTDGYRYSLIVMRDPDGKSFKTRVIRDDITTDSARARVRVIHAAPGIDEVNVVEKSGEKIFDGVNFTSEAGYKAVMPFTGAIEFRTEDDKRVLLTMPKVDLQAGQSYTIVLARNAKGALETFWFKDTAL